MEFPRFNATMEPLWRLEVTISGQTHVFDVPTSELAEGAKTLSATAGKMIELMPVPEPVAPDPHSNGDASDVVREMKGH